MIIELNRPTSQGDNRILADKAAKSVSLINECMKYIADPTIKGVCETQLNLLRDYLDEIAEEEHEQVRQYF